MKWNEACKYILQSESGTTFKIKIEEGMVSYLILEDTSYDGGGSRQWEFWCMASEDNEYYLNSYTIVGDNSEAGPSIPQEERVCRKIKVMEERWAKFQAAKKKSFKMFKPTGKKEYNPTFVDYWYP